MYRTFAEVKKAITSGASVLEIVEYYISKIKSMANKQLNHDYLPHTLLNLFKVQSSVYKKDFSLI